MILSIRGNIMVVRPSLRPKFTRVFLNAKTTIIAYERTGVPLLKPGMRVGLRGLYSERDGLHPFFIEAADRPEGNLKRQPGGIQVDKAHGRARAVGRLKSVQPFIFTDDDGKDHGAKLDNVRFVVRDVISNRQGLLIGSHIRVSGSVAPDGVIQAEVISPDSNYTPTGTLFGSIVAVNGATLTIRPKYSRETVRVTCAPNCTLLRQIDIDPDTVKEGDRVTFWGEQHNHPWDDPKSDGVLAYALLLGDLRYPAAQGSTGGVFLTGKIASLDPVRLTLTTGKTIPIVIPAQMPTARLVPMRLRDLQPNSPAMFVLRRGKNGRFEVTHIVLGASPFVGYGG
jgi:hypothetical protein